MKWISFVFSFLFLSLCAFSAPFGLKMGMTAEEVISVCNGEKTVSLSDDWHMIKPAKKHSLFENYRARIDKKHGLYFVRAKGFEIDSDEYGTTLKEALEDVKIKLSKTYGEPVLIDELDKNHQSYYSEANKWTSSIFVGFRTYKYVWEKENLPADILKIEMYLDIGGNDTGRIVLDYELANHKDIQKEEDTFF